jgi:ankyrin repeat protein
MLIEKPNASKPASDENNKAENINPNDLMRLMDRAIQHGTVEDLEALFDGGMRVDQTDWEGRTALQMLSSKGDKQGVEMLLSRGADVNAVYRYQGRVPNTALDAALGTKNEEIVELLKAHGAKTGKQIENKS